MKFSSSFYGKAALAAVALAAAGTATVAQARDNVYFSVGANVAPGVSIGVSNGPMYYPAPVYVRPAPVYGRPAPVYYYEPAPVYYSAAPVYYGPAPVYVQPRHWKKHRHHRHSAHVQYGYGYRY
ncbi:MAG: hypothetical protein Q8R33_09550 [Burkholderiales bacterium]|nr:hypothetical protein [Burkholderiales bacterium]